MKQSELLQRRMSQEPFLISLSRIQCIYASTSRQGGQSEWAGRKLDFQTENLGLQFSEDLQGFLDEELCSGDES